MATSWLCRSLEGENQRKREMIRKFTNTASAFDSIHLLRVLRVSTNSLSVSEGPIERG